MSQRLLFISNGYGEDIIAAHIARTIQSLYPDMTVCAFPTVGGGDFYSTKHIPLAGQGAYLPSEGFVRSLKDFARDVKNGFFIKTLRMGRSLGTISRKFDTLIIVGDPYLLLFSSLCTRVRKSHKIFIGVQQSEWYGTRKPFKQHYSFLERLWMRAFAGRIYVRDHKTMEYLRGKGLRSVFCSGNPMMDCFSIHEKPVFPSDKKIIGILPGSKKEAYENCRFIFEIIYHLSRIERDFIYAIALSPQLDTTKIQRQFGLKPDQCRQLKDDTLYTSYNHPGIGKILISQNAFGDIINESVAVIGMSGTGNEQAAGLGKPVFASWGRGPQITKKFMVAQKRLLGPSLFLFPPDPAAIAHGIIETLSDKALLNTVAENGRIRMSGRGSIRKMAREIVEYMQSIEN